MYKHISGHPRSTLHLESTAPIIIGKRSPKGWFRTSKQPLYSVFYEWIHPGSLPKWPTAWIISSISGGSGYLLPDRAWESRTLSGALLPVWIPVSSSWNTCACPPSAWLIRSSVLPLTTRDFINEVFKGTFPRLWLLSWPYFKSSCAALKTKLRQSTVKPQRPCGECRYGTIGRVLLPKAKCSLWLPQCAVWQSISLLIPSQFCITLLFLSSAIFSPFSNFILSCCFFYRN